MDDTLLAIVLERLDARPLGEGADGVLLASLDGPQALASHLGAATVAATPQHAADIKKAEPAGVYLRSVTVTGFRGIGARATLPVNPGPGLTLVVGRNGSGKSSFAEALEVLLTGDLKRW